MDENEELKEKILLISDMLENLDWEQVPDEMKKEIVDRYNQICKTCKELAEKYGYEFK